PAPYTLSLHDALPILTVPLTGMLKASDPRVASTVDAIRKSLTREQLVYRYLGEQSEFGVGEGAFLVCSFWLVDVLAQMGRADDRSEEHTSELQSPCNL